MERSFHGHSVQWEEVGVQQVTLIGDETLSNSDVLTPLGSLVNTANMLDNIIANMYFSVSVNHVRMNSIPPPPHTQSVAWMLH